MQIPTSASDVHLFSPPNPLHEKWRADNAIARLVLPAELAPWLSDRGSLTSALKAIADGTFEVRVISQRLQVPRWHEQKKLGRELSAVAMVREVNLFIHGEAVVFARSIIPLAIAGRGVGGLANLGGTPLGHLLFRDGRIRVSRREFCSVRWKGQQVHARRTPYDYLNNSILVSEYFLPSLRAYL